MATRNPADTSQPNFKGCDWYEPYRAWTVQKGTACPGPLNSAQVYGHDTWNGTAVVQVDPIMVEYPA
ncbi:hypothetical protein GCM10010149_87940 [Nonomuraea roseoviolacea subsp. roseoviolacea]|uniref:hypothetical protein n=1 Tax=Nonomuraea roseoviolacea TaxID=103837 RepID=UPI0031D6A95D